MVITASNGRNYDLENLSNSDRALLIQLGHLPKTDKVQEAKADEVQEAKADEVQDAISNQDTPVVIEEDGVAVVKNRKKNESTRL